MSPMAPAATEVWRPQLTMKPGRCTVRKEMCSPQTKKPKKRNQKVGVRKARESAWRAVSSVAEAAFGAGLSLSGMASGIISSAAAAITISVTCQPKPARPNPTSGTTRNCPKEDPAVPSPAARPRWLFRQQPGQGGDDHRHPGGRDRDAHHDAREEGEERQPRGERHAERAERVERGAPEHHGPPAIAVGELAHEGLARPVQQHLQRDGEGEARGRPGIRLRHRGEEEAEGFRSPIARAAQRTAVVSSTPAAMDAARVSWGCSAVSCVKLPIIATAGSTAPCAGVGCGSPPPHAVAPFFRTRSRRR
jgi:hypothetical protein